MLYHNNLWVCGQWLRNVKLGWLASQLSLNPLFCVQKSTMHVSVRFQATCECCSNLIIPRDSPVRSLAHEFILIPSAYCLNFTHIMFIDIVHNCHKQHQLNPQHPTLLSRKGALKRSLFTVGVLCKHFDFDSTEMGMKSQAVNSIEDFVFEQLMYFLWHEDEGVRQQALTAIGM